MACVSECSQGILRCPNSAPNRGPDPNPTSNCTQAVGAWNDHKCVDGIFESDVAVSLNNEAVGPLPQPLLSFSLYLCIQYC